jgi:hypothetical protein
VMTTGDFAMGAMRYWDQPVTGREVSVVG